MQSRYFVCQNQQCQNLFDQHHDSSRAKEPHCWTSSDLTLNENIWLIIKVLKEIINWDSCKEWGKPKHRNYTSDTAKRSSQLTNTRLQKTSFAVLPTVLWPCINENSTRGKKLACLQINYVHLSKAFVTDSRWNIQSSTYKIVPVHFFKNISGCKVMLWASS